MRSMLQGVGADQLWGQYGFWDSGIQVSYMHDYT
jgi:hypothetical protein